LPSTPEARALLALALDLLAHAEASHRAATRLEAATRVLTRGTGSSGTPDPAHVQQVRAQITALEELSVTNRTLLSEFSREMEAWLGGPRGG
jgi:hypothetical protein